MADRVNDDGWKEVLGVEPRNRAAAASFMALLSKSGFPCDVCLLVWCVILVYLHRVVRQWPASVTW